MRLLQFITLRLTEERADGFSRMAEAGIVFIHLHLRDDRDRFLLPAGGQAVVECLLDQIADSSLRVRHAVRQRRQRQPFPLVGDFGAAQIQPDLRAVTVGQHDVIVRGQHFQHRLCHRFHRLRLMLNRLAGVVFDNAVAANGNDHKRFHTFSFTIGPGSTLAVSRLSSTCFTTNIPPIIR